MNLRRGLLPAWSFWKEFGLRLPERVWGSAVVLLVLTTLFWSGNFVIGRAVSGVIPPIALAFCRWTGALLVVIGFAWPHVRRDLPALRASWRELLLLSALGVSAFNTLVYFGLRSTTVINGVLMQSTMPLLILLGAYAVYGERTRSTQLLAILVSLTGVAVIVARGSWRTLQTLSISPGDGLIFLAVVCYAFYSVLLRKRPQVHPLSFLSTTFALGAALLLPLFLWEHFAVQQLRFTPVTLAAIGYVSVFPSLLSYLFFNRSVELIGASRVGQFLHLMPVFGSVLAAIFLGERLHGHHLAGIVLIGAGIGLASAVAKTAGR